MLGASGVIFFFFFPFSPVSPDKSEGDFEFRMECFKNLSAL